MDSPRRIVSSTGRKNVLAIYTQLMKESPNDSTDTIIKRTSSMTGVSKRTIYRIKADERDGKGLGTPGKKRPNAKKKKRLDLYDSFSINALRRKIHSFFKRNEIPTLNSLLHEVNAEGSGIFTKPISRATLHRLMRDIGFTFKRRQKNSFLIEREDIVIWRRRYLRKIKKCREEKKPIFYLDETWVNAGHTKNYVWQDTTIKNAHEAKNSCLTTGLKAPSGKGARLILTHVGNENGFLNGAEDIFVGKKSGDFHEEMDGNHFENWFKTKLIPRLKPKSVIVLDNASYHSVKKEKLPTKSWSKPNIQNWLTKKSIPWTPDLLKLELMEIANLHRHKYDAYNIDEIAKLAGHEVLRLPPYHCELNPIELIWGLIKEDIASKNKSFKMREIKELLPVSISKITPEHWSNTVAHTIKKENEFWEIDGMCENIWEQKKFVLNLNSSSGTEESESTS